ncbi:hypothetical protein GF325_11440 [Candidatus Bathyarchaeota archaeon]|nr:hypothetical protein [Candidatus Bathyarchaeota archaeon]
MNNQLIDGFYDGLDTSQQERVDSVIDAIVDAKNADQGVVVATGSGPNIHEGVTTLIAEMINKGVVDGVLTSSAVIAHEMAGALDEVKRVDASKINMERSISLPKGDLFELSIMPGNLQSKVSAEMALDMEFIQRLEESPGEVIIKAAGNMGYPMGLRTEILAEEILELCENRFHRQVPFEQVVGLGASPHTMIGAGVNHNVPILVSIPQLVGGGAVGMCIGDSISIHRRAGLNATLLAGASLIIESGLALAQEIHDGPLETYTGHGIWSEWQGRDAYSLQGKTIARIDLDPNLESAWVQQRDSAIVQDAIDKGLPKTKITGVPFRMEMSGFARLDSSIPIIGDLGEIWPIIASRVSEKLGIDLDFMSYKQETREGKEMRRWIVDQVHPVNKDTLLERLIALE